MTEKFIVDSGSEQEKPQEERKGEFTLAEHFVISPSEIIPQGATLCDEASNARWEKGWYRLRVVTLPEVVPENSVNIGYLLGVRHQDIKLNNTSNR